MTLEDNKNDNVGSIPHVSVFSRHRGDNPIENNRVNEVSNESIVLQRDDLYIGPIDPLTLDFNKMTELLKHQPLIDALKSWTTTPNHDLIHALKELGRIVDEIYDFKKDIICYRGIRTGMSLKPTQNLMGVLDDVELMNLIKPGYKAGSKFKFNTPGPMSVARSPWIAKIYGDFIVKCVLTPNINKLVITNELAYLLQQMDRPDSTERAVNLSVRLECIVFPGEEVEFEVVSTYGDISSELPELEEHSLEQLATSSTSNENWLVDKLIDMFTTSKPDYEQIRDTKIKSSVDTKTYLKDKELFKNESIDIDVYGLSKLLSMPITSDGIFGHLRMDQDHETFKLTVNLRIVDLLDTYRLYKDTFDHHGWDRHSVATVKDMFYDFIVKGIRPVINVIKDANRKLENKTNIELEKNVQFISANLNKITNFIRKTVEAFKHVVNGLQRNEQSDKKSSSEGFFGDLKKTFSNRKPYKNLFDLTMMQKETLLAHRGNFDLSTIPDLNSIKADEYKEVTVTFNRIENVVHDYDYPETSSGIKNAAEQIFDDLRNKTRPVSKPSLQVKRETILLSDAEHNNRIQSVADRLKKLEQGFEYINKYYLYEIKRLEILVKNIDKAVPKSAYRPIVREIFTKQLINCKNDFTTAKNFYIFFITEYTKELTELKQQSVNNSSSEALSTKEYTESDINSVALYSKEEIKRKGEATVLSNEALNEELNWRSPTSISSNSTDEEKEKLHSLLGEYVYHGGPIKYNILKPTSRKDFDEPVLFFSPFAYMASLFCTEHHHVRKGLYDNKYVSMSSWTNNTSTYEGLDKPAVVVEIVHNIKDLKPYTIIDTGYLHCVKTSKVINKILPYNRWDNYYEFVYFGNGVSVDKVIPVKQTIHVRYDKQCSIKQGGDAIPSSLYAYRILYNNVEIYDAFKQNVSSSVWNKFKNSDIATWLPIPEIEYKTGYKSYFTERGLNEFCTKVLPYFKDHLDNSLITIEQYDSTYLNWPILYSDKYQFVTNGKEPTQCTVKSISEFSIEALSDKQEKELTLKKITGTDEEINLILPLFNAARTASDHEAENEEGMRKWLKRPGGVWFLVYDNSDLVGMTSVEKVSASDAKLISSLTTDCIEIGHVAIAKEQRGKGYGLSLMKTILKYIDKHYPDKPIIIRCASNNKAAVGLYKKSGFVVDKTDHGITLVLNKPELDYDKKYASSEALSPNVSKKKAAIIKYICDVCDILDPSKTNSKRYHRILDHMTDKEFDQWMNYVKEGKWQIHIVAPNMIVNLKNENILKAADKVGCKLFHRLWIEDPTTGRKYLTDNEYLILNLPVRRQQQFLDEKMSVPDHDRTIDGLTGQVTGDSRASSITNPEIQILAARGLETTLQELVNVRGGNMHAYAEFKRQAEETGDITMGTLDPNTRSRVAVVGQVMLNSMMLDTNIVE